MNARRPFPALAAAAALAAVLALAAAPARADGDDAPARTISLSGEGEIVARPDTAAVTAGVVTEAADAQSAVRGNSDAVAALFSALRQSGIADRDIQTTGYSVSPSYSRPQQGEAPRISGYRVSNSVTVQVRDLARLGKLLDRMVAAGANQLNGVRFYIDDSEKLMDEARRDAVADARRKADLYAVAAGATVGRVIAIREEGGAAPPNPVLRSMVRAAPAESVPVAAGEQTLRARVSVTYELE